MKKNNKISLASLAIILAAGLASIAISYGGVSMAKGVINTTWNHYYERMPSIEKGIKEYWVSCDSHEVVYEEPTEGTIVDMPTWDDSGFEANDARYTYDCPVVVAPSALSDASSHAAPNLPGFGFSNVTRKLYSSNQGNGYSLDLSDYDYISFGLYADTTLSYIIFGGTASGGDTSETAIADDNNFTMWGGRWYYLSFEKNSDNTWNCYIGDLGWRLPNRTSASLKLDSTPKSATNLSSLVFTYNWSLPGDAYLYSTEVVAYSKTATYYRLGSNNYHGACFVSSDGTSTYGVSYNSNGYLDYDPSGLTDTWTVYLPTVDYSAFSTVEFAFAASAGWAAIGLTNGSLYGMGGDVISGTITVTNSGGVYTVDLAVSFGSSSASASVSLVDTDVINGFAPMPVYYQNGAAYRVFRLNGITATF